MGIQVVTNENIGELMTSGKVADFKPPEPNGAAQADNESKGAVAAAEKTSKEAVDAARASQARGADGKFQPADPKAGATPAAPNGDDDDSDLPERVRRQIGRKHRAMKEAEEFATQEGRRALQAERRAEALEQELAALRGGNKPATSPTDGPPVKPEVSKFTTVAEYLDAMVEWKLAVQAHDARAKAEKERQTADEAAQAAETKKRQAEAEEAGATWVERSETFQESTPDFETVLEACDLELHNAGMQYVVESEVGPQLAYFLAKPENQHHITRLNKLIADPQNITPKEVRKLLGELGKLEDKLATANESAAKDPGGKPAGNGASAPAATARQVSKAPAPITPLASDAGSTPTHKDPSEMSFAELRAFRQQEALAKAGRRA